MGKYTVYGSEELDRRIDRHMQLVCEAVTSVVPKRDLVAVVLGGGYGRGEGGVFQHNGSEELFNDYDMFVVVKNVGRRRRAEYLRAINGLRDGLNSATGIEVDFGPLKTLRELEKAPFWLFYYELRYGHKIACGDQGALSIMPNWNGDDIPPMEGMKLLLNRAVGLMLVRRKLREHPEDEESKGFIIRNIFKAHMAVGDVLLMMKNDYDYSYQKRLEVMEKYKDDETVRRLDLYDDYCNAVRFKLRPQKDAIDSSEFETLLDEAVSKFETMYHLALGACCRTEHSNGDLLENIKSVPNDWSCPAEIAKNVVLNFRDCGLSNCSLRWFLKYPRCRLFFTLPFVLFRDRKLSRSEICKALSVRAGATNEELENRFLELWRRYE
jgi:hypothetical protein